MPKPADFPKPDRCPPLAGLVLCGGQSARMGHDKGLLATDGKTWAELAHGKLRLLTAEVYVSVRAEQAAYTSVFPAQTLVSDSLPLRGPLAGLLSAHQKFPQHDWLVLACDLPDMTVSVLWELAKKYYQNADYECFVFANENELEPLCGIYTAAGLCKIKNLLSQSLLKKHSMKHVLEISKSCLLPLPADWKAAFKNYNSAQDRQG